MKMLAKLSLITLALSVPALPALAIPDAGPDYVLKSSRVVREWVPAPEGPGGAGTWSLIDVRDRTYFLGTGDYRRVLDHRTPQAGDDDHVGVGARHNGAESTIATTPGEAFARDILNPSKRVLRDGFINIMKLSEFTRWEDRVVQWPWTTYEQYRSKTRDILTYRFDWTDPFTHGAMSELDLNLEYSAWTQGSVFERGIHESGTATASRHVDLPPVERELVIYKAATTTGEAIAPLEASAGSRNSSYTSDQSSTVGRPVALQGGKVRAAMRASEAVVSSRGNSDGNSRGGSKIVLTDVQKAGLDLLGQTLKRAVPQVSEDVVTFAVDDTDHITIYRTGDQRGKVLITGFGHPSGTLVPFTFQRKGDQVEIKFTSLGRDFAVKVDLPATQPSLSGQQLQQQIQQQVQQQLQQLQLPSPPPRRH